MSGKDFVRKTAMSFFIIVTCVTLAIFVLGQILDPDAQFGYEAFLAPLIYGICGTIPCLFIYSKKELSIKALIVRKILQIIALELILVLVVFGGVNIAAADKKTLLLFCLSVLIVYVVVHVILWLFNMRTAMLLTKDLKAFQERF